MTIDSIQLPEGPLLLSPDRLVQAFKREVILRKPEEFKISCLRDVRRLFGTSETPFFAGFGNRITDAMSCNFHLRKDRSVDIPSSRIFTVDSKGEVKLELIANFKSSYIALSEQVDQIFPSIDSKQRPMEEFGDFMYWNQRTFDDVDIEKELESKRKKAELINIQEDDELSLHEESNKENMKERMERIKNAPFSM